MPAFVLVPGAWLGGWVWKKVTPSLQEKGHDVYPITLTGMGERVHLASSDIGIETAVQDVLNVIKYNDLDDFILVGHSFAGKVVGAVADRVPNKVRLLLYLDALRPEKTRGPQAGFDPTREFGPLPQGSLGIPLTEKIIENIGKDVKDKNREWMLSKATPWLVKLAKDPITLSEKFDSVKSAYIFCTLSGDPVDEIVSGKWGELYGPHKLIETGHWPMVTKPEELADDMLSLST
jgi:pimeloyl-ACP methyl ester carboxylesterase